MGNGVWLADDGTDWNEHNEHRVPCSQNWRAQLTSKSAPKNRHRTQQRHEGRADPEWCFQVTGGLVRSFAFALFRLVAASACAVLFLLILRRACCFFWF